MKQLFKRLGQLFAPSLPIITEESPFDEILLLYPGALELLRTKYQVKLTHAERQLPLKVLCQKYELPTPQIVFMEVQLFDSEPCVQEITSPEAKELLEKKAATRVFDVREGWEKKHGALPRSEDLSPETLAALLKTADKSVPILVYCHFGIRSRDAASYLSEQGFSQVYCLKGGIDSWALNVDPSLPRYSGAYC